MIRVTRPSQAPAEALAVLDHVFPDGLTELQRARAHYSQVPTPSAAYPFKQYKEHPVCSRLDAFFKGKCAYCESPYRAVDASDVEHFRPKGGVSGTAHRGYWWLAAVWSNLLVSCPACNQRRYHHTYDPGMTLDEIERRFTSEPPYLLGKGNLFPLVGNNWVTMEGGDLTAEDPLLLNPCDLDPTQYFEWVFDWDKSQPLWLADWIAAIVRPVVTNGVENPHAKASIAIYGLNRLGLVRDRMTHLKAIQMVCAPLADIAVDITRQPNAPDRPALEARANQYRANVNSLAAADRPYSGMTSAFVNLFDQQLINA